MKKLPFATSMEFKAHYKEQLARWKKRSGSTLTDLSRKCGVTPSYLSQISRYGRIPGKPVLILLALNLEVEEPELFFRRANEKWPFSEATKLLHHPSATQVNSDLAHQRPLLQAIQGVIRHELQELKSQNPSDGVPAQQWSIPTESS